MQDSTPGPHQALRVAGVLVITALVLGLLEIAQVFLTTPDGGLSGGSVFKLGFVSGALLLNVSLLLGASTCLGAWALSRVWHRRGVRRLGILAATVLLVGACWGVSVRLLAGAGVTRALGSTKTLATIVLCGVLVMAIIAVFVGARHLLRRRPGLGRGPVFGWGVGIFFVAILVHLANRGFYVGLYPEIHSMLALATSVMVVALLWWFGVLRDTRPHVLAGVWLMALLVGAASGAYVHRALTAEQHLLSATLNETTIAREALLLTWSVLDFDRDGHSGLFGGGDCDDTDPFTHPGALEVAGNGADEDCIGGDLPVEREVPRSDEARSARAMTKGVDTKPPDILLFSVDALRADRLSCDASSASTPTMHEVAARGTCFTNTYVASTSSASSLPAIAAGAYFSSLYPEVKTGASAAPKDRLPMRTILNDLARRGYRVIATVPASFRSYFLDEGIEWSTPSGLSTPSLAGIFRQVEDGGDGPLALWFHHMGAHLSFTREFVSKFRGTGPNAELNERYDAAVRRVDDDLRTLLDWQSERAGLDNTIIVITADHGEALGEHNGFGHAMTLYEEVLRVPLIISLPGSVRRVVDQRVSIVDVAPTLRQLAGLEPAERTDGISLVPLLDGQTRPHPPIYAENFLSSNGKAVVWSDWKLIFTTRGNVYELYDLRADPNERNNLVDAQPARVLALQKLLTRCAANGCRDINQKVLTDVERTLLSP